MATDMEDGRGTHSWWRKAKNICNLSPRHEPIPDLVVTRSDRDALMTLETRLRLTWRRPLCHVKHIWVLDSGDKATTDLEKTTLLCKVIFTS